MGTIKSGAAEQDVGDGRLMVCTPVVGRIALARLGTNHNVRIRELHMDDVRLYATGQY